MSARSSPTRSHTSEAPSNKRSISPSTNHAPSSPNKHSSPKSSALSSPNASHSSPQTADDMISTITTQQQAGTNRSVEVVGDIEDAEIDHLDNGSSSLSEIEVDDVSDDEETTAQFERPLRFDEEVDSEAETEHLEKTPKKPSIIQHDGAAVERSPSKLSTMLTRDELDTETAELESISEDKMIGSPSLEGVREQLSVTQSKGSLGKRKRNSPGDGESSDALMDEPSPKRNHAIDDELQLELLNADNEERDEARGSDADEDRSNEATIADDVNEPAEQVSDPATANAEGEEPVIPKGRFGRRGRRKGRKDVLAKEDTPAETSDTPVQDADEQPAEVDEEEEAAREEEMAKRRFAAEALTTIEKDFIAFREKHLQEQLEQIESEMSILREPSNCVHPDYLARLVCLDERRDEKLHYENTLLKFNLKALVTRTIAERGQLLSQYHQEIRETRDRSIDNCYKELYALQKDRRRYGTEESSITLFSTSRPEQLRAQAAYNMEVSILAGVSKHIGFPAAPEISPLSPSELQRDLEIMEINRQPAQNVLRAQSFADRTQAGDQFLERTPWANPQHPAHANGPVNNFHTQGMPINFATPAQQRQFPNNTAINGSASTIDMMSNPPSSAAGPAHAQHYNPVEAPTPIPAARTKEAGRIQTTHDSSGPAQSVDSIRLRAGAAESSPPDFASSGGRLQQQQSAFQSPSRIGPSGANASIAMPIGADGFGQASQRAAVAPVGTGVTTIGH